MIPQDITQVETTANSSLATKAPLPEIAGYDILSILGRGGMGRVYLARHRSLGRMVAIKMLIDAGEEMLVARFHTESQAAARLQHPNIAQVFETGHSADQPFLVLEYVDGGSLAPKLAGKPQPPMEAAQLVETLARAIEHSHQHGILHRDLKPANILLASDGTPKITDFGLAKRLQDDSHLTRTGEILGTPSYMAPEQASGVTSKLGPAVDIYALGAILYEMLTGRPPFQGPDSMQTLMMVLTMEPVPPGRLLPNLPRDLETICLKCLERLPRKRYASAAALADDLRRFQEGRPIFARPVRSWERVIKWAKRRPAAALLIALGFAAILALIVGYVQIRAVNTQLEISNRETEESLLVASAAIDSMLVRLSDQLAPIPQSDQLRRESLEDARKLYEKMTALRPQNHREKSHAAEAMGKLGKIYAELGRLDDAEAAYRKTFNLNAELKSLEPDNTDHRRGCANMLLNIANLERRRGKSVEAEVAARSALAEIEPLLADAEPLSLQSASAIYNTLALALRANKKADEGLRAHEAALKWRKEWLAKEPNNNDAKIALTASLSNIATTLTVRERPGEAVELLAEAEKALAGQSSPQQRFYLGQIQGNRAIALEVLKKDQEAEAAHRLAVGTFTALVGDFSAVPGYRHLLAKEHLNLGRYYGPRGRSEEALRHLRIAGPILERLVQEYPDNQSYRTDRDLCRTNTGWAEEDLADAKKKKS